MSWKSRGTNSVTGLTSWSNSDPFYSSYLNDLADDVRTWGANVDASGNGIANLASISGQSGALAITAALTVQGAAAREHLSSTTPTNNVYKRFVNTAGNFYVGIEDSVGQSISVSAPAYAAVLSIDSARALCFGTNNTVRQTISSGGVIGFGVVSPYSGNNCRVHARTSADKNLLLHDAVNLSDGVVLQSINDALSANRGFELIATDVRLYSTNGRYTLTLLPQYANNAAALAGGLTANQLYLVAGSDPRQIAQVF